MSTRRRGRSGQYTTGEVAELLGIAPRTASKLFDAGEFPGGWRIPGSGDRRIPRDGLVAFLRDNGMPIPAELAPVAVVLCFADPELDRVSADLSAAGLAVRPAPTLADLFVLLWDVSPSHLVADADRAGVPELTTVGGSVRDRWPRCVLACTRPDDGQGIGRLEAAGWRVVDRPLTAAGILNGET